MAFLMSGKKMGVVELVGQGAVIGGILLILVGVGGLFLKKKSP